MVLALMGAGTLVSGAVKCPGCGAQVAAGTAICPKCDNILDMSFLDASAPEGTPTAAEETQPRATMPKPPSGSARAARPPSGANRPVGRPPTRGAAKPVARSSAGADESTPPRGTKGPRMPDAPQRVIAEKRAKVDYAALDKEYGQDHLPAAPAFKAERMTGADEAYEEAKQFLGALASSDKLAMVGAALLIMASFLPWKITAADGEVLGLVSTGLISTIAAIASIASIYVRVKNLRPQLNPIVPWMGQLGSISIAIVWCLVFVKISWDGTMTASVDGNVQMMASKPDAGVFIAIGAGLISLAGTLAGLKDQRL